MRFGSDMGRTNDRVPFEPLDTNHSRITVSAESQGSGDPYLKDRMPPRPEICTRDIKNPVESEVECGCASFAAQHLPVAGAAQRRELAQDVLFKWGGQAAPLSSKPLGVRA